MKFYPSSFLEESLAECRKLATPLGGTLVWDCVVPAELCPPGNKRDSIHWTKAHKMKAAVRDVMRRQVAFLDHPLPLPGKPRVVLIRYTPHRTDPRSNWDKFPVDMLRVRHTWMRKGKLMQSGCLGIIVDDSGDHIDLSAWWERSRLGVVYVRVYAVL